MIPKKRIMSVQQLMAALVMPRNSRMNRPIMPITKSVLKNRLKLLVLIVSMFGFADFYSLFFVSMQMVTGPSFNSSTFMSAPNSPVPTGLPRASDSLRQNSS